MSTTNDIRAGFLDYFAQYGHTVVESSPLVPRNDPTLMFVNSGMVQFKNVFTGAEKRDYVRAATSQKCVRAGGKHNDLENVGHTARHHTFFEMLGNFSFGDYFKDLAIELAWNLVTKEYGLPADRLMITVYAEDDEAYDLWRKIAGLSEDKVIRIPTSDNFWAMGDTGPCGPCSEIFYDHGEGIPGGPPGGGEDEGDRFVEIWNLVFMQFEQVTPDNRVDLPRPSIDTGMGLERLATVMQGNHDNYDTDVLRVLIEASAEASSTEPDGPGRISHRVIADHMRAVSFLIADGVLPSNEGRGYVLRRIMRRAMRHVHLLGTADPMLWQLVPTLVRKMGRAFPELERAELLITETLKIEETRFRQMLDRGLRLLEQETAELPDGADLPGEAAFRLYDTFGFPLDLTEDALKAEGRGVDIAAFDQAMESQRAQARAAWAGSGEAATEQIWFDIRDEAGASEFLGYEAEDAEARMLALVAGGHRVDGAKAGDAVAVVTNQTPFYGEAGGQVGDTGTIAGNGFSVAVTDTQKKLGDLYVHFGEVSEGEVKVGDEVAMVIDGARGIAIRANHSATHLLHEALRRRLGGHVTQKGSLVAPDRLRFDVSHPKALEDGEIDDVEVEVNARVRGNEPVVTRLMSPDDAVGQGAMALFGEKYGDEVRVVSMGTDAAAGERGGNYSVELCGGTHVERTGDIGVFKIVSEGAVAAGVRRIEALTGAGAQAHLARREQCLMESAALLKVAPGEVPVRITQLLEERRRLERELVDARRAIAASGPASAGTEARDVAGVKLATRRLDGVPARELKGLADEMKASIGSCVVAVLSVADGKASLVVGISDDLTDRLDAVELVRAGAAALGGKGGGGRPDMAQAGGPGEGDAAAAFAAVEQLLSEKSAAA